MTQSKSLGNFIGSELVTIQASYIAAYDIAKAKKPFIIAESLVKPLFIKIAKLLLGDAAASKIDAIPLSARTITRRITEMAQDINDQLSSQLQQTGHFKLQFDESTDIAGEAVHIGFVRYVRANKITEELFCFCSLPERTTAAEIFNAIEEKMQASGLDFKNLIGLCSDGAASMTGRKTGLAKRFSAVAHEEFLATHCILHREALASKKLSPELNQTLEEVVKMVNNVKMNPLNSRIFAAICNEMGSDHDHLLLHTEVRWLSRGRVFCRLFELKNDLKEYFSQYVASFKPKKKKEKPKDGKKEKLTEKDFLKFITDEKWLANLAYLADIFALLNELQTQGTNMNCFVLYNKVEAFGKKLLHWKNLAQQTKFDMFPSIKNLLSENKSVVKHIQPLIIAHLGQLIEEFQHYFPASADPRTNHLWIVHPFLNANEPNTLELHEMDELLGNLLFNIYLQRCLRYTCSSYFFVHNFCRVDFRFYIEKFI